MLSFIVVLVIALFCFLLFAWTEPGFDVLPLIFGMIGTILSFTFAVMIVVAVVNNVGAEGKIASNRQRYESLTYQLENNLYDNDNDLGKKDLYDQIQAWNEDLAEGKAMQYDIWVGAFYPNIYDEFDFIELK